MNFRLLEYDGFEKKQRCQSREEWADVIKEVKFKAGKCGTLYKGRTLLHCWAGEVMVEGPAVPLTFGNETVKLGNGGQSVMFTSY